MEKEFDRYRVELGEYITLLNSVRTLPMEPGRRNTVILAFLYVVQPIELVFVRLRSLQCAVHSSFFLRLRRWMGIAKLLYNIRRFTSGLILPEICSDR